MREFLVRKSTYYFYSYKLKILGIIICIQNHSIYCFASYLREIFFMMYKLHPDHSRFKLILLEHIQRMKFTLRSVAPWWQSFTLLKDTVTTSDQTVCMVEISSHRDYGSGLRNCSTLLTFYQTLAHMWLNKL